jgi:ribosomal protein S18 acetylase RimI-like enzyme/uncharacterized membrane protein YphA (DoxX/SURF4 family)
MRDYLLGEPAIPAKALDPVVAAESWNPSWSCRSGPLHGRFRGAMAPPLPDIALRLARTSDAAALARLSDQLGFPLDAEAARARLRDALGGPDHALIVAESGGRVAGLIELKRVRLFTARRQVEVISLVVDEDARGRGIGKRLLEEAERWAADLGCRKVRVRSRSMRDQGHALYRSSGYEEVATELCFEKQLGPAKPKSAPSSPRSIASQAASGPTRPRWTPLTVVRVAVAALLIVHAGSRVATGGVAALGEALSASHVPFGRVLAWAITIVEIAGGLALAAGRFARSLSLWFAAEVLLGIALVPRAEEGLVTESTQGAGYAVLLVACLLALAWGSPGRAPTPQ